MATSDGATRGMQGLPRAVKWRAWIATALVTLLLAGVGYRAWGLQVEDAETFRERRAGRRPVKPAQPRRMRRLPPRRPGLKRPATGRFRLRSPAA